MFDAIDLRAVTPQFCSLITIKRSCPLLTLTTQLRETKHQRLQRNVNFAYTHAFLRHENYKFQTRFPFLDMTSACDVCG